MAAALKAQTWITNREGPHFLKPPGSGIHKMKHLDMVKEKKKTCYDSLFAARYLSYKS